MSGKILCCILSLMLMLGGCESGSADIGGVAEYYAGLESVSAEAEIKTNSGALICYEISFLREGDTDSVTILSPESIAGITARLTEGKTEIVYEDLALETLLPDISGYAPADAVSGMIEDLESRMPEEYGFASLDGAETIKMIFKDEYDGGDISKIIWVSKEDFSPIRAEFYIEDTMVMELQIISFSD